MKVLLRNIFTVCIYCICYYQVAGQTHVQYPSPQDDIPSNGNLTIVYDIKVISKNKNPGIEESYNGGIKTFMQSDMGTRVRLVSLMRIQSIYFLKKENGTDHVIVSKESGKQKYKYYLTPAEWKNTNSKYNNINYNLENNSMRIAGYDCKKAIIRLSSGKIIVAWYSTILPPVDKFIDPLFSGLPGMVLRYELSEKNGTMIFNAAKVSREMIDKAVFKEPGNGYLLKKRDGLSF